MRVTHRAIRQDLRRLTACLSGIAARGVPSSRVDAICRYTAALLAGIRAHLDDEDRIVWPVIAAAAGAAVDLTPLTDDHEAIRAAASQVSRIVAAVRADPGALADLHAPIDGLRDMLDEHIEDEEAQIFPAMLRYLPADAYWWCEEQLGRTSSPSRRRFAAPWLARYAWPDEQSRLLARGAGWPGSCWPPLAPDTRGWNAGRSAQPAPMTTPKRRGQTMQSQTSGSRSLIVVKSGGAPRAGR